MKKFYNIAEAGRLLGYSRGTITSYIKRGILKSHKIAGDGRRTTRISKRQIEEFLENSLTNE